MIELCRLKTKSLLLAFVFSGVGGVACYLLQLYVLVPSFISSAAVGFVGSFIPRSKHFDSKQAIACVYTGSFAFMCSLSFFSHHFDVLLLTFLVAAYYTLLSPYFRGFGGKLGSVAFVATLSFVFIKG